MNERVATHQTSIRNVVMLAALAAIGLSSSVGTAPTPTSDTLAQRVQVGKVGDVARPAQIALAPSAAAAAVSPFKMKVDGYYEQLRSKMHWLPVRYAGNVL